MCVEDVIINYEVTSKLLDELVVNNLNETNEQIVCLYLSNVMYLWEGEEII